MSFKVLTHLVLGKDTHCQMIYIHVFTNGQVFFYLKDVFVFMVLIFNTIFGNLTLGA